MDALETIFARRSITRLAEPAPTDAEIETMLAAAVAAADHGEKRPWRFVILSGDDRLRFGELLAATARAEGGDDTAADTARTRLLRAPVVVGVICRVQPGKISADEQRDAVASAAGNLVLAATALGYGSIWRTGPAATSPVVRDALGLADTDSIVGFIYLGTTPDDCAKPPRRLDPTPFIEHPPLPDLT